MKKKEIWSIGLYQGENPFSLSDTHNQNPILTADDIKDIEAEFVADPFIIKDGDIWYMFFEVLEKTTQLGRIGMATSPDGINWKYDRIVLAESYHLSYPYVFKFGDDFFMCPESCAAGASFLYRTNGFPDQWEKCSPLITGHQYVDPTLFYKDNLWWLMVGVRTCDELYLFYADRLEGPYQPHSLNPVVSNNKQIARPAGRPIMWDNRLIRFGQDSTKTYGGHFWAVEILSLNPHEYKEEVIDTAIIPTHLYGNWSTDGRHHIDLMPQSNNQWIAVTDGKVFKPF